MTDQPNEAQRRLDELSKTLDNAPQSNLVVSSLANYGGEAAMGITAAQGIVSLAKCGNPVTLSAMAGGYAGTLTGEAIANYFELDKKLANILDGTTILGAKLKRIPEDSPVPVVVGKQIAHRKSRLGMWLSTGASFLAGVAGVAIGVAVAGIVTTALTAATFGVGAPAAAFIGASVGAAVGAYAAGAISGVTNSIAEGLAQIGSLCGEVIEGSPNVTFQNMPVARVSDKVKCNDCGISQIAEGSNYVSVNELPLARIAHHCGCGAVLAEGIDTITADLSTGTYGHFKPDISENEMALLNGIAVVMSLVGLRSALRSEPIDMITGDYVDERRDFVYDSILPLELKRTYLGKKQIYGLLGRKWLCNWSQLIYFSPNSSKAIFLDENGYSVHFEINENQQPYVNRKYPQYQFIGTRNRLEIFNRQTQITLVFEQSSINEDLSILKQIHDRNSNNIDFVWDEKGYLTRIIHSDGVSFSVSCNRKGHLTSLFLDGDDNTLVRYNYDDEGRLIDAIPRFSNELHYKYTNEGWLNHWHDSGFTKCDFFYDTEGRVIEVKTPQGFYNDKFKYFLEERKTQYIDATGACETFWYNNNNLLVKEENALGHSTTYKWGQAFQIVKITDALGRATNYTYFETGEVKQIADWAGRKTNFSFDEFGQILEISYPNGNKENWQYDLNGNIERKTLIEGGEELYSHDQFGRILSYKNSLGKNDVFQYDALGHLKQIETSSGNVIWLKHDLWGRILSINNIENQSIKYEYTKSATNPWENISQITHPDGGIETFEYNREGLLVSHNRNSMSEVQRIYGAFDLLDSSIDAHGKITKLRYDGATRLTSITNAAGKVWRFHYDKAGQVIAEQDFSGRLTRYTYDEIGRIISKTRPNGEQYKIDWDERDHLAKITTENRILEYNYNDKDLLSSATSYHQGEEESRILLYYDKIGRLSKEIQNGNEIDYLYDNVGRRVNRTSESGETEWAYNPIGFLSEYISNNNKFSFDYNALGLLKKRSHKNGFQEQLDYDSCGRLARQSAGNFTKSVRNALVSRHYQWDKIGRLIAIHDSQRGINNYHYDKRDQIIGLQHNKQERQRFDYDSLMNMLDSDQGKHIYNPEGDVIKVGENTFTRDDLGRVITRNIVEKGFRPKIWQFTWDEFDHLIAARTPEGNLWRYTYDAFNRRISKECVTVGQESKTTFVWDGFKLAEEWTEDIRTRWHYEEETLVPVAKEVALIGDNEQSHFLPITTDHLGTPKELFDDLGICQWRAQHSLWGRLENQIFSPNTFINKRIYNCNLRFQGQYEDEETGLYYNIHRYYDPISGMYISNDPIGLEGGLRQQGYVHNPNGWIDPLGLITCGQNAKILRSNMGKRADPNKEAGHIVASGGTQGRWKASVDSRKILDDHGIDINDGVNGIPVSKGKGVPNHGGMHTRKFHEQTRDRLQGVVDRGNAKGLSKGQIGKNLKDELDAIGRDYLNSRFPK